MYSRGSAVAAEVGGVRGENWLGTAMRAGAATESVIVLVL